MVRITAFLAFLLLAGPLARAVEIHVSPAGGGDGSPGSPTDLQSALDTSRTNGVSDTIKLMEGTYDASSGAFTYGSEDNDTTQVVLSGGWSIGFATQSEDPGTTILDGGGASRVLDVRTDGQGIDYIFEIQNLTIRNGRFQDFLQPEDVGAGLRAWNENGGNITLFIRGCAFRDNEAAGSGYGGGLGTNCLYEVWDSGFVSNRAHNGGAVYTTYSVGQSASVSPSFRRCWFEDNHNEGGWQGSTVYSSVSAEFRRCRFEGRKTGGSVGAGSPLYLEGGGFTRIENSVFRNFTVDAWGSAIQFWNSGGTVTNCLFHDNKAGGDGLVDGYGTITVYFAGGEPQSTVRITNSTFARNRSRYSWSSGGAVDVRNNETRVENCVFWDCGPDPVFRHSAGQLPSVSHSFLDVALTTSGFTDAGGNLVSQAVSPFVGAKDFRLVVGSSPVDTGDGTAEDVPDEDLDGNGRPFDGDGDGTATVDMGAYELTPDVVVDPAGPVGFGTVVLLDTSDPRTVSVTNEGTMDLSVGQITLSQAGGDFAIQNDVVSNQAVAPGATLTLEVVFAPDSVGDKAATLTIPCDDPDTAEIQVDLTGRGREPAVSPKVGTIGTLVTLRDTGLGEIKGKAWIEWVDERGRTKRKTFKVVSWGEELVEAFFRARVQPGAYRVFLQTKVKGEGPRELGEFTVKAPELDDLSATEGGPGAEVTLDGFFFGDRKAKSKLTFEYVDAKGRTKRKKCKVVKDSVLWDYKTGRSSFVFLVPKLASVTGKLLLVNRVGGVTVSEAFTVLSP